MSTYFNTQTGKEIGYDLQFHTEDKEKYEFMQEAARRCIDNKIVFLVDGVPIIHTYWERIDEFSICHNCGYNGDRSKGFVETKFCPQCGAKMYKKENEK